MCGEPDQHGHGASAGGGGSLCHDFPPGEMALGFMGILYTPLAMIILRR